MKSYVPNEITKALCAHPLWKCGSKEKTPKNNFLSPIQSCHIYHFSIWTLPSHGLTSSMTNICPIIYLLILSLGKDPCAVETVFIMYTRKKNQQPNLITQAHTRPYSQKGQDESKGASYLGQGVLRFALWERGCRG